MNETKLRLVLIEDHDQLRTMYARFLQDAGDIEVVAVCATAGDGIDATARLRPDVVLIDLSLPDMPGLDAVKVVRASDPDVRVIVVSGADADLAAGRATAAGADAYVDKIDFARLLIPTIASVMSGA